MAQVSRGEEVRSELLTLRSSEHPALAFIAARRVRSALRDQPPHAVVTAAKLVSEIVDSVIHKRAVRAIDLEIRAEPGSIRVAISGTGNAPDRGWKVDRLVLLLLERLSADWGEEPASNRIWFELAPGASRFAG